MLFVYHKLLFFKNNKTTFLKSMNFGVEDMIPYFDKILVIKNGKIYHSDTLELKGPFTFGFVQKCFPYHSLTNLSLTSLPMVM